MELVVFVIAALGSIAGAAAVIVSRNPVHAALGLVGTLFAMAVLFVAQDANFLAAVQVIVYAGAIVVLFLFVIMLLGVDRAEEIETEPIVGQRPAAIAVAVATLVILVLLGVRAADVSRGASSVTGEIGAEGGLDVESLGRALFTDYVFAFELTSVLLVVAVVGAVVLSRRPGRSEREGGGS